MAENLHMSSQPVKVHIPIWKVFSFSLFTTAFHYVGCVEPSIPRACIPPHNKYRFCNSSLPLDTRLDDLISRLTLEEKPTLLIARESPKGNISRLGIPEYDWGGNCIHGVQSRCAPNGRCPTSFPNPNTLGASFNESLWKMMGRVIGIEMRSLWLQNVGENHPSSLPHFGLDCWSPNVGIQRDPRWGRNMETPSEDPYLCGKYGSQYSLGLQNNSIDPRYLQGVATLKHFDANSLEGNWYNNGTWGKDAPLTRHTVDADISSYDLRSSYLPAFRTSVIEGGAAGVMCSYNSINGVPSCANGWLLQEILRDEWKFRGYVVSDSGAVVDILSYHHYSSNWTETVAKAINAGCDIESAPWPRNHAYATDGPYIKYLPAAVSEGLVSESAIDKALKHSLGLRFRLGLFDPIEGQPFWHVPPNVVQSAKHVQLAKDSTGQGFVLLKNDRNLLPLKPSIRIAVIGPHSNDRRAMLGNYLGEICFKDSTNQCVTSFFEGFEDAVKDHGGSAKNATGCTVNGTSTTGFEAAVALAKDSDVVVFVGGIDGSIEGEGYDRPDVRLPQIQVDLIREIEHVNKNIIVTLLHGGMVGIEDILNVSAIISTGYPGRYGGEILAKAVLGLTSKAWGKLPVTFYKNNIIDDFNMTDFDMSASPGRTYRYYTGKPIFPFGYGLNPLTTFSIRSNAVSSKMVKGISSTIVSVQVANEGSREGDEVIMAFLEPAEGTIPCSEPASKIVKQLFRFKRVSLKAGESCKVKFLITTKIFQLFDSSGNERIFPGNYTIQFTNGIGASSTIRVTIDKKARITTSTNLLSIE